MKTIHILLLQIIMTICSPFIFNASAYALTQLDAQDLPLEGMTAEEYQEYINKLEEFYQAQMDPVTYDAIKDIADRVSIVELLAGAHIVVRDKGELYLQLKSLVDESHNRTQKSSHYNNIEFTTPEQQEQFGNQYGIDIPLLGHILFGARPSKNNPEEIQSWLQFEGANVELLNLPLHMLHYLQHKMYGYQIGPMGMSPYTEKWVNETVRVRHPEQYGSEIIVEKDGNENHDEEETIPLTPIKKLEENNNNESFPLTPIRKLEENNNEATMSLVPLT